jgi:hypothetical protein
MVYFIPTWPLYSVVKPFVPPWRRQWRKYSKQYFISWGGDKLCLFKWGYSVMRGIGTEFESLCETLHITGALYLRNTVSWICVQDCTIHLNRLSVVWTAYQIDKRMRNPDIAECRVSSTSKLTHTNGWLSLNAVFLNDRAAAMCRAMESVIPGRENLF